MLRMLDKVARQERMVRNTLAYRTMFPWTPGRVLVLALVLGLTGLAGCGSSERMVAGTPAPARTPAATATPGEFAPPTATPTAGMPCQGGPWGQIIAFAGAKIPLPPSTVAGPAETFPPSGSWVGHYQSLCTGGNLETVASFQNMQMAAAGWSFGAPPNDCVCNGAFVWSQTGDGRLVQFEPHPSLGNGQVRWGVTIYTRH